MFLSVVIPVFNEEDHIASVLARVETVLTNLMAKQKIHNYEIIIIDDGSKDNTHDVLKSIKKGKHLVMVLNDVNRGKGAALQTGFKMAKGCTRNWSQKICFSRP